MLSYIEQGTKNKVCVWKLTLMLFDEKYLCFFMSNLYDLFGVFPTKHMEICLDIKGNGLCD